MPYEITINGMVVKCERPEDVLALVNVQGSIRQADQQNAAPKNVRTKWVKKKTDYAPLKRFLTEVGKPTDGRIELGALAKALGFDAPKGLGGYWTQLNKASAQLGFKPARVVTKETVNGDRYYVGGPDIQDLLKRLASLAV